MSDDRFYWRGRLFSEDEDDDMDGGSQEEEDEWEEGDQGWGSGGEEDLEGEGHEIVGDEDDSDAVDEFEDGTAFHHGDFGQDFLPGHDEDIDRGFTSDGEDEDDVLEGSNPRKGQPRRGRPSGSKKTYESVQKILQLIKDENLTLPSFLSALSWGDYHCARDVKMAATRRSFLHSRTFRMLLYRWWKPPRSSVSRKKPPEGGRKCLTAFAYACTLEALDMELQNLDPLTRTTSQKLSQKELTDFDVEKFAQAIARKAPVFWSMLKLLATTEEQRKANTHKNPQQSLLLIITMLLYSRSQMCNKLQRVFAFFFKFKGLKARGFEVLHSLGITMSYKWTTNAVKTLSKETMLELRWMIKRYAWAASYDNLHIGYDIYNPKFDKVKEDKAGTAAIVHIKKDAPILDEVVNRALQKQRAVGQRTPINTSFIWHLLLESQPRIEAAMVYEVLDVLLGSDEFKFKTYRHRKDPQLQPPSPVRQLPSGPDHISHPYMLGTMHISESSLEGNSKVVDAMLTQLGVGTNEERQKLGVSRLVFFLGDQLTVGHLRTLQHMRCQDPNSFDRMDHIIPIFGWLHFEMTEVRSLHKQYLGTETGLVSLRRALVSLGRKDLMLAGTQGDFHEKFSKTLKQVMVAHIRACWVIMGRTENLEDLRNKGPRELAALARKIVDEFASTLALNQLKAHSNFDQVKVQAVTFLRDVLQHAVLRRAMKYGDVGLMEDLLPHKLLRFAGGQNSHYTGEVLELLQGLHREWVPEVKDFVRNHTWLMNQRGKPDSFRAADDIMEDGIKAIKDTHSLRGPKVDWKYFEIVHPVIPVVTAVSTHVETQFKAWSRYTSHTASSDKTGIQILQRSYLKSGIYETRLGRTLHKTNQAKDYVNDGFTKLQLGIAQRWAEGRDFVRATEEDWPSDETDDSDVSMAGDETSLEASGSAREDGTVTWNAVTMLSETAGAAGGGNTIRRAAGAS
ncbi:hypothetical protein EUX98_g4409 [Antrodiella citrinella]|uniref:DUF6589 domain-containing protein n=1 Tax=Antrodiella citrinella TaxID=2447956 RepID=A0A4S4MUY9_9APHY|nr:hypothetical protein EUX98_g4409 [Antrodiella citrinella]